MKAYKKPVVLKFRRATGTEVINTLEGPVTAGEGDAVLTGTKGESWPIGAEIFFNTYDIDEKNGSCSKKFLIVEAEQMNEPFLVNVVWSKEPIYGNSGDYRITYGPGDYGVVSKEIFDETYVVCE